MSDDEIERLRRSGRVAHSIPLKAPKDGVVIESNAVEGMHAGPHRSLYRTADLSALWLIADVHEKDLGAIRPGQRASAIFTTLPGRTFSGTVDLDLSVAQSPHPYSTFADPHAEYRPGAARGDVRQRRD